MIKLNSLIIIFGCFLLIDCLKEENTDIELTLNGLFDKNIGKKGTVVIRGRPSPDINIIDTSKTVRFQLRLTSGEYFIVLVAVSLKLKEKTYIHFVTLTKKFPPEIILLI